MALAATSEHLMQKIMLDSSGALVGLPKPPRPMYESMISSLTRCAADPLLLCCPRSVCRRSTDEFVMVEHSSLGFVGVVDRLAGCSTLGEAGELWKAAESASYRIW